MLEWNDETRMELLDAVGFDAANMDGFDCLVLSGAIIREREVFERRIAYTKANPDPENPGYMTDDPREVVRAMSPIELEELRERILVT
jgi:hypothetical protein